MNIKTIVSCLFLSAANALYAGNTGMSSNLLHISENTTSETRVYEGYKLADEGAWCWFADPRALHYRNSSGTIDASYIGYIDVHGNVKAVQYNFINGERTEVMIRSYFQPDDHNNPTFLILPDERVMIFYSRHTDEPCFYYRISAKPGDITSLGEEKKIMTRENTTYPSPFILSDDPEHIYLCWRGINWHPTIAQLTLPDKNDNVSISWGPYQMVQSTGARPYAKYHSNGKDKIMFTYTTGHPDNEPTNWLYYNYVDIKTKQLKDVNGRVLSNISDGPLNVNKTNEYATANPLCIVDNTAGIRDWVWQISSDKKDRPVIAMVKINGPKTQHDYYYANWDGKEWKKTFLASGGGHFHQTPDIEKCYSGGMAIDDSSPNTVYCSVPCEGNNGKVYEIMKCTVSPESGLVEREMLTENSRKNNIRPYVLSGSDKSPLRLVWMHGDYYDWIVSSSRPGYPTSIYGNYEFPKQSVALDSSLVYSLGFGNIRTVDSTRPYRIDVKKRLKDSDYTISFNLRLSPDRYYGTICKSKEWSYELDSLTMKPYIMTGDKKVYSTNVFGTADSWKYYGRGTNGKWYPAEKYTSVNITITYSGNKITTYINGALDQTLENVKCPLNDLYFVEDEAQVSNCLLYSRVLNSTEIQQIITYNRE